MVLLLVSFPSNDNTFKILLKGLWLEYAADNAQDPPDASLFWEMAILTAVRRGLLISLVAHGLNKANVKLKKIQKGLYNKVDKPMMGT